VDSGGNIWSNLKLVDYDESIFGAKFDTMPDYILIVTLFSDISSVSSNYGNFKLYFFAYIMISSILFFELNATLFEIGFYESRCCITEIGFSDNRC
jgi:hypothetical protein